MARSQNLGPWKRADLRSIKTLWEDAARILEKPPPSRMGLMSYGWAPGPYKDADAAREALRAHPIYGWLEDRIPGVLKLSPPGSEIEFVRLLVINMAIGFDLRTAPPHARRKGATRPDKKRRTLRNAADLLLRYLDTPAAGLVLTPPKLNMLAQLLAELQHDLSINQSPGDKSAYPALEGLANALYKHFGIADPETIKAIGDVMDLNLDDSTARRYVAKAKKNALRTYRLKRVPS